MPEPNIHSMFNFLWNCQTFSKVAVPFFFFYPHLRTCLLNSERRERRKRERKKHQAVASHAHPNQGPNLQPRHVPWLGIEPATFCFARQCPTHWATPARAHFCLHISLLQNTGETPERTLNFLFTLLLYSIQCYRISLSFTSPCDKKLIFCSLGHSLL